MDLKFSCQACGQPIAASADLRPGRQFIITCVHCGHETRGGVMMGAAQQASCQMSPQQSQQNMLMSGPQTSDQEDAMGRAQMAPKRL